MQLEYVDALEYLRSRNIYYSTEGANTREGWVQVTCPFCNDETNHLGINLDSNGISCWKCKTKGSLVKYVMRIERIPFDKAVETLENFQRLAHGQLKEKLDIRAEICKLPKGTKEFPPVPGKILDFIESRKLSLGNFMKHACGWTTPYNPNPCRIIFPLMYQRRMVSYVMRDYSGLAARKYVNASDQESAIPPKDILFGYDEAPENSVLVAVEGIIDKMKLGRRALATLGTGFTKNQVLSFRMKKPKKIYILFDSEVEAQKIAQDLAFQIWYCPTEIIQLTQVSDPGELTESEGVELMRQLI